jgi:hypothetical protein
MNTVDATVAHRSLIVFQSNGIGLLLNLLAFDNSSLVGFLPLEGAGGDSRTHIPHGDLRGGEPLPYLAAIFIKSLK